MNVLFRTNCNGTLGHLARCRHLSLALNTHGYQTHFLLDESPEFKFEWIDSLSWQALYTAPSECFESEEYDARLCASFIKKYQPSLLIVDDYRLGIKWELETRASGCSVMAIDDLRRDHCADILLEPRYVESSDNRQHPERCALLQGPRYTLLDAAYAQVRSDRPISSFNIMFSLGGGGDLIMIRDCIQHLLDIISLSNDKAVSQKIRLTVVIGPLAENANSIHALAQKHPELVLPVEAEDNLAQNYQDADLFVGAAGTSVYEAAASGTPALTFSLSPNQRSELKDLEPLGHFFHINEFTVADTKALALLIKKMVDHYPRLQQLRNQSTVLIDGKGVNRVSAVIHKLISQRNESSPKLVAPTHSGNDEQNLSTDHSSVTLTDAGFQIKPCDDVDINRYLDARNLNSNRDNMTTEKPIRRLDHYRWWFSTARQSYCVQQAGETKLYIWHEAVKRGEESVLIGGWFVATEATDIACVMTALSWQLELTDKTYPTLPWVAVIKKSNQFVLKMNERAGFQYADPDCSRHRLIQSCFPDASPEEFHFVYRGASAP